MATATQSRPQQRTGQRGPTQNQGPQHQLPAAPQAPHELVAPEQVEALEQAIGECAIKFQESTGTLARAFAISYGLRRLEALITPGMMTEIMSLMNSPLGFLTDKNPAQFNRDGQRVQPYTPDIVKRCVIEASLRGAHWVGNEMNIIASRAYLTKEYFRRKVDELPGLSLLQLLPGVPTLSQSGQIALVPFVATWRYNGRDCSIERTSKKVGDDVQDRRIPVIVNKGMSVDAILGKAERKMLAAIYRQMTGSKQEDLLLATDETTGGDVIDTVAVSQEELSNEAIGEPTAEQEAAEVDQAQAAHEGSQEEPTGREPGSDDDAAPASFRLSPLCLAFEERLHDPNLWPEVNLKIKQEIIDALTKGELTPAEATHLQGIVARNQAVAPAHSS